MGRSDDDSPSPPRGHRRRTRSPSPRGRYGGRDTDRDLPTSLLVRNLRRDCRPDDLRRPFGKFGPVKDIYLPKDYYTREPRGFGFIQYFDPEDASDAKYYMDGKMLLGREIAVVFAEENRKKPSDMRAREKISGRGRSYDGRLRSRSPGLNGSPRGRSRSQSRSYSPAPKRKHYSRSPAPRPRERSLSRSPAVNRSRSASPIVSRSPHRQGSLSVSE